jgi:hypothetical protein
MFAKDPGVSVKGDTATAYTPIAGERDLELELGDCDALMRKRGLNPDDWEVKTVTVNEWESNAGDGEIITLHQLKINLVRKVPADFVFPATDVKQRLIKIGKPKQTGRLVACLADQHAPYQDKALNDRVLSMLAKVEPDEIVNLGDIGDYPTISKHRDNPAWSASAQESVQGSFELLSAQRDACPASKIVLLKGNHDWRLETELLARAERMFGIKPAQIPGADTPSAANSLHNLLHLDALGVQLIEPELEGDEYKHAEYWITERLAGIHGSRTGPNAAVDEANDAGVSIIMGHLHRYSLRALARWVNRQRRDLIACECPTLAAVGISVGYTKRPKWSQGLVLASAFDDGSHNIEGALWDGAHIHWRGERW